jgi:DNA polymerase III subunit delta
MPVYLYYGEDAYALENAAHALRKKWVDAAWEAFNYQRLGAEAGQEALNIALTPAFGQGDRLIWLENAQILQGCSDELYKELERTLPLLPPENHLLFSIVGKPDKRLKSTKFIEKIAKTQEFTLIASWNEEALLHQVQAKAQAKGLRLSAEASVLLADAVGNDTRCLENELEKLSLYTKDSAINDPNEAIVEKEIIEDLVPSTAHNSFQLASSILQAKTGRALDILHELLGRNEPALKVSAVLISQFRTWTWIKVLSEKGGKDPKEIAEIAEIGNPKRVFFLQKEVKRVQTRQLLNTLEVLVDLEVALKSGNTAREALEIAVIRLCKILQ